MKILRKLSGYIGPVLRPPASMMPSVTATFDDDWRESRRSCDGFPGGDVLKHQAQARRRDDETRMLREMGLLDR